MKTTKFYVLVLFLLTSIHTYATITFTIGNLTYALSGSSCYVYDCPSSAKDVVVPSEVVYNGKTYPVTSIREAFQNCNVMSVVIPNSVTEIVEGAFSGCSSLQSITIPNSVTSIGKQAFYECTSLESITIPNSVTSIGSRAFYECTSLESITIPNSVTSIGWATFYKCSSLKSITIPNSVTSIGKQAFYSCALKSITIPNSVTSIGEEAFRCCPLWSVTIGSGVKTIGKDVFGNNIKIFWLANTPSTGYEDAVAGDSYVHYVPNNSYTSFSEAKIYPYLSSMFEVDGIKYVPVNPSERTCDAVDCAYDSTAINVVIGKTARYKGIDMSVKNINDYVCAGNDYIKNVEIDYDDLCIPERTFESCSNLTSAKLFVKGIGDYAFSGCALTNIELGTKLEKIGDEAFSDCSELQTIDIPNSVTSIGWSAFEGCSKLQTIDIPNSVTSIGGSAFEGCSSLTSVSLSSLLKKISYGCFRGCSSLTSVNIGDSVETFSDYCFSGCSALPSVNIGSSVETVGNYCFRGCSSFSSITIPSNVKNVGELAFYSCDALEKVYIADRETALESGSKPFRDCPLKEVYIGGNINYSTSSSNGYSPFYSNTTLETVTIGGNTTEVTEKEFYGCTNLKTVSIGNGVDTIGNYAFTNCSSLDRFSFGTGMKTIGTQAFSGCTAMTKLIAKTAVPPTCGDQALDDINKWTCTLYVPAEHLDAYKAAAQWKDFFFFDTDAVKGVTVDEAGATEVARYSLDGTRLSAPQKGINIVRMSDGAIRKVLVK